MTNISARKLPDDIANGDELRNVNSYDYLAHIAEYIDEEVRKKHPAFLQVATLCGPQSVYNEKIAYGNLYTTFLLAFENNIQEIRELQQAYEAEIQRLQQKISVQTANLPHQSSGPQIHGSEQNLKRMAIVTFAEKASNLAAKKHNIDEMITAIYANSNHALERSAKMVEEVVASVSHSSPEIETAIRRRMMGNSTSRWHKIFERINYYFPLLNRNRITPQEAGSRLGRLKALLSQNFKPQTTTSIPSIRRYQYQENLVNNSEEYRSGTAGQIHQGEARVSPTFEAWLEVEKRRHAADDTTITHVYFNLLGLDRTGYEGNKEKSLTQALHQLEDRHTNIAVITLPADKGLMDKQLTKNHKKTIAYEQAWERMFGIAKGRKEEPIRDFHISLNIKQKLYGKNPSGEGVDEQAETEKLEELLTNSFNAMGFKPGDKLSEANMQAVYFHFMKFEIPDFILEKTGAKNHRFPCKDGIDRGGVASAYYNLMKSLKANGPLTQAEFDRALHAAPTLVKGRGMNHHRLLIWNAVDNYIKAKSTKEKEALPAWLTEWRNDNAPPHSRKYYQRKLEKYIEANEPKEPEKKRVLSKLFRRGTDVSIAAANKLQQMLEENTSVKFTPEERKALSKGKLGKIRKGLEQDAHILHDLAGTYESLSKEKLAEEKTKVHTQDPSVNIPASRD